MPADLVQRFRAPAYDNTRANYRLLGACASSRRFAAANGKRIGAKLLGKQDNKAA